MITLAYTWSEEFATGNVTVDTQHKQLFIAINNLLDACSSGQGRAHLSKTLDFLIDYTVKHFSDEEKLQQQCNYPDYQNHKKLHDDFKITVGDLAKQLKENGSSIALVTKVNSNIGDWIVNHIKNEDKKVFRKLS
jgi:hemerythrin